MYEYWKINKSAQQRKWNMRQWNGGTVWRYNGKRWICGAIKLHRKRSERRKERGRMCIAEKIWMLFNNINLKAADGRMRCATIVFIEFILIIQCETKRPLVFWVHGTWHGIKKPQHQPCLWKQAFYAFRQESKRLLLRLQRRHHIAIATMCSRCAYRTVSINSTLPFLGISKTRSAAMLRIHMLLFSSGWLKDWRLIFILLLFTQ